MAKSAKEGQPSPGDDKKGVKRSKEAQPVPTISSPAANPRRTGAIREPELEPEPEPERELELEKGAPLEAEREATVGKRRLRGRADKTPLSDIPPELLELGQNIRRIRRAKNLTQMEVAHRCGFNSAAVFMVEAGRQNMTIKSLMTLAAALDLKVADLFPRTATQNNSAKLAEVADTIAVVKTRVTTQLQMLDRLATELRVEAGITD
jgi:transcriptional regulator with XRE-family HTH domain